jgi:LPS export ABC transporter protein LptC
MKTKLFGSINIHAKYIQRNTCIILIFGALIFIVSCQSKVSTDIPIDLLENKSIPIVDATKFETTYTDSGVVRYHLKTNRLLDFSNEKVRYHEFPEGFHLQAFDKDKKITSELSGNYGKEFIDEGRWIATGNVVMVNNKGDTLRTEELNYVQKEDLIYTNKFVSIKKGDQFINGYDGFKSDAQMTKIQIKNTKGHVYMEEK